MSSPPSGTQESGSVNDECLIEGLVRFRTISFLQKHCLSASRVGVTDLCSEVNTAGPRMILFCYNMCVESHTVTEKENLEEKHNRFPAGATVCVDMHLHPMFMEVFSGSSGFPLHPKNVHMK